MPSHSIRKPGKAGWLLLLGPVLALTACGGSTPSDTSPTGSSSGAAPTSSSAPATPTPSVTVTPTTPTASPTPSALGRADIAAATAAVLHLYSRSPNNVNDPSAGYIWSSAISNPTSPVSTALRARLNWLNDHDYFDDRHCGEDYIDGNQVGLTGTPKAISATANPDGTVTVVIRGYLNDDYRDLTVVMSKIQWTWLATDLRRGTGPNASIFSSHPNC